MIKFYKYVAAGNDFIIIDNREGALELDAGQVRALCDRRFGIGADGVLVLTLDSKVNFRMNYFNADGSRGEMCGNGARALVNFAVTYGQISSSGTFLADDGEHAYRFKDGFVAVEILVTDTLHPWIVPDPGCGFINTGVPHLIIPVENVASENLDPLGVAMNAHPIHPQGTNVNIVNRSAASLQVRTWERGVNMETLACGTGATAVAIYANQIWGISWPVLLSFKGGQLEVDLRGNQYWLKGPSELVFEGQIALSKLYSN